MATPRPTDTAPVREPADRWSTTEAAELYDVASWGKGYFSVGANGNLWVHPDKDPNRRIDLKELADNLQLRGISLPILVRFGEILKHRLGEIHQAFQSAISEYNYKGSYCCVFPIKVNQQRQVVEEVFEYGRPYKFGLEAGSKPELLAVLAIADNETPIICNGFKDDEYIEMVMLARKIGRNIIPVVEKYTELDLILKHSQKVGVRPVIGLRVKLASRGLGTLEVLGRLPLQVRPDDYRGTPRSGAAKGAAHGGLPATPSLPLGQPDHQHPADQGRRDRSRARVC